jgi:DNA-binding GntR family transcriptional regulator
MTPADDQQPLRIRIAASLRQQISDGALPEGARLPSEASIAEQWKVSRPTVRLALDELRREGMIVTRATRGTFVRRKPPIEIRSSTRYRRRQPTGETSPFATDARREGAEPGWQWRTERVKAEEAVAGRLGIGVGDYVMQTRYLYKADGRPVQISTSWEPHHLVGGSAIEEPEGTGGPVGVIARMDSIDIHVDRVTELVRARVSTSGEREELEIPEDTWVMSIERTHWAGERAVETCNITIPADRYALAYEIPVDG